MLRNYPKGLNLSRSCYGPPLKAARLKRHCHVTNIFYQKALVQKMLLISLNVIK